MRQEMNGNVIDVSRDRDSGEITQFTIIDEYGQPQLMKGTISNQLLYDPADELPFDSGLASFFEGDEALILSEEPDVMVAPTSNEYCYVVKVRSDTIETTPNQSNRVLAGIKEAIVDDDTDKLIRLHEEVMETQVRREIINALRETFEQSDRITSKSRGWLVDDFYLVDWTASMYTKNDDPDENDVRRSGDSVVETDSSYEFVQGNFSRESEPITVGIQGDSYRLTEREMLFLSKVTWLLDRREYHPDMPFWYWNDKRASVDAKTGEPEESEESDNNQDEPSDGSFNL
jgi:hypothetical protein